MGRVEEGGRRSRENWRGRKGIMGARAEGMVGIMGKGRK